MAVKSAQLTVKTREERGSRSNRRLRETGQVPAVIYGHKEAVLSVAVPKRDLVNHLEHGAHLFDLNMDGGTQKALVKDVQYDHLGIEVLHVDFTRVSLDEKVEVTVALELKGTPKGEADGGVLQQIVAQLEVECLVTEIPEVIRHNVADMALNDVLHLKDIKLPDGVRAMHDPELILALVKEIVEEVAPVAATEAGAAEPEVIGRKAEDEGAEAAEGAAAPAGEKKAEKK